MITFQRIFNIEIKVESIAITSQSSFITHYLVQGFSTCNNVIKNNNNSDDKQNMY